MEDHIKSSMCIREFASEYCRSLRRPFAVSLVARNANRLKKDRAGQERTGQKVVKEYGE